MHIHFHYWGRQRFSRFSYNRHYQARNEGMTSCGGEAPCRRGRGRLTAGGHGVPAGGLGHLDLSPHLAHGAGATAGGHHAVVTDGALSTNIIVCYHPSLHHVSYRASYRQVSESPSSVYFRVIIVCYHQLSSSVIIRVIVCYHQLSSELSSVIISVIIISYHTSYHHLLSPELPLSIFMVIIIVCQNPSQYRQSSFE